MKVANEAQLIEALEAAGTKGIALLEQALEAAGPKGIVRICRYSQKLQEILGAKTDPKPWLHCMYQMQMKEGTRGQADFKFVIYVWDTRQIIESGETTMPTNKVIYLMSRDFYNAYDNHQPLKGPDANKFNELFAKHDNEKADKEED